MAISTDGMDEIIDQAFSKVVERAGILCRDEKNVHAIFDGVLEPVVRHVSVKFAWLVYAIEVLAALVILQTLLICIVLYYTRRAAL